MGVIVAQARISETSPRPVLSVSREALPSRRSWLTERAVHHEIVMKVPVHTPRLMSGDFGTRLVEHISGRIWLEKSLVDYAGRGLRPSILSARNSVAVTPPAVRPGPEPSRTSRHLWVSKRCWAERRMRAGAARVASRPVREPGPTRHSRHRRWRRCGVSKTGRLLDAGEAPSYRRRSAWTLLRALGHAAPRVLAIRLHLLDISTPSATDAAAWWRLCATDELVRALGPEIVGLNADSSSRSSFDPDGRLAVVQAKLRAPSAAAMRTGDIGSADPPLREGRARGSVHSSVELGGAVSPGGGRGRVSPECATSRKRRGGSARSVTARPFRLLRALRAPVPLR